MEPKTLTITAAVCMSANPLHRDAQCGGAADVAGSAAEASLLSQEEYLLVTNRLHQVLRPFMMRRLKEAVATELPGKVSCVGKMGVCERLQRARYCASGLVMLLCPNEAKREAVFNRVDTAFE